MIILSCISSSCLHVACIYAFIPCRGCSKEDDCKDSSGNIYNGDSVVLGGTRIYTRCCEAHKFDDDDAIAIDMGDICNSATSTRSSVIMLVASIILGVIMMSWG